MGGTWGTWVGVEVSAGVGLETTWSAVVDRGHLRRGLEMTIQSRAWRPLVGWG